MRASVTPCVTDSELRETPAPGLAPPWREAALLAGVVALLLTWLRGPLGWPWIGVVAGGLVLVRETAGPRPGPGRLVETAFAIWTLAFLGSLGALLLGATHGAHLSDYAATGLVERWAEVLRAVSASPSKEDPLRPLLLPWYDLWRWVGQRGCLPGVCAALATGWTVATVAPLLRTGLLGGRGATRNPVLDFGLAWLGVVPTWLVAVAITPPDIQPGMPECFTSGQGMDEMLQMWAFLSGATAGLCLIDAVLATLLPPPPTPPDSLRPAPARGWPLALCGLLLVAAALVLEQRWT